MSVNKTVHYYYYYIYYSLLLRPSIARASTLCIYWVLHSYLLSPVRIALCHKRCVIPSIWHAQRYTETEILKYFDSRLKQCFSTPVLGTVLPKCFSCLPIKHSKKLMSWIRCFNQGKTCKTFWYVGPQDWSRETLV